MAKINYRPDIDGLRAIAVVSVVLFHFGFLDRGYLGVDIFFVISGFLITSILLKESQRGSISLINFYIRRVRRIIPLVLFFCLLCLILGSLVMLPDDFENLSQSVVATILFSNNILLYLTSGNYWEVINEFKPLMHTWSLGVEEQFYLLYPLLFSFSKGKEKRIVVALGILSLISFILFIYVKSPALKFYSLPFRFFELSLGGLVAICADKETDLGVFRILSLFGLLIFLVAPLEISTSCHVPVIIILSGVILWPRSNASELTNKVLGNRFFVFIGKISFSLYLWHQVLLAFYRYTYNHYMSVLEYVVLFILIFLLSVLSYIFIEQPFRNRKVISTKMLFKILALITLAILAASLLIYSKAGVIRDVPELDIRQDDSHVNMHADYILQVYAQKKTFLNPTTKNKVLVVGDSFARDWVNVLQESSFGKVIDVVCINDLNNPKNLGLASEAKVVFYARRSFHKSGLLERAYNKSMEETLIKKLWIVGTKNFGLNAGIFYNYKAEDYCSQRTFMEKGYLNENDALKAKWGERYIDVIGVLKDEENKVRVFTPECKLISQDCRHLTKAGAEYVGIVLNSKLNTIW